MLASERSVSPGVSMKILKIEHAVADYIGIIIPATCQPSCVANRTTRTRRAPHLTHPQPPRLVMYGFIAARTSLACTSTDTLRPILTPRQPQRSTAAVAEPQPDAHGYLMRARALSAARMRVLFLPRHAHAWRRSASRRRTVLTFASRTRARARSGGGRASWRPLPPAFPASARAAARSVRGPRWGRCCGTGCRRCHRRD